MQKPKSITDLSKVELEDICLNLMSIEHKKTRIISDLEDRINKAIEILKLCNSKCAKETIEILKGETHDN